MAEPLPYPDPLLPLRGPWETACRHVSIRRPASASAALLPDTESARQWRLAACVAAALRSRLAETLVADAMDERQFVSTRASARDCVARIVGRGLGLQLAALELQQLCTGVFDAAVRLVVPLLCPSLLATKDGETCPPLHAWPATPALFAKLASRSGLGPVTEPQGVSLCARPVEAAGLITARTFTAAGVRQSSVAELAHFAALTLAELQRQAAAGLPPLELPARLLSTSYVVDLTTFDPTTCRKHAAALGVITPPPLLDWSAPDWTQRLLPLAVLSQRRLAARRRAAREAREASGTASPEPGAASPLPQSTLSSGTSVAAKSPPPGVSPPPPVLPRPGAPVLPAPRAPDAVLAAPPSPPPKGAVLSSPVMPVVPPTVGNFLPVAPPVVSVIPPVVARPFAPPPTAPPPTAPPPTALPPTAPPLSPAPAPAAPTAAPAAALIQADEAPAPAPVRPSPSPGPEERSPPAPKAPLSADPSQSAPVPKPEPAPPGDGASDRATSGRRSSPEAPAPEPVGGDNNQGAEEAPRAKPEYQPRMTRRRAADAAEPKTFVTLDDYYGLPPVWKQRKPKEAPTAPAEPPVPVGKEPPPEPLREGPRTRRAARMADEEGPVALAPALALAPLPQRRRRVLEPSREPEPDPEPAPAPAPEGKASEAKGKAKRQRSPQAPSSRASSEPRRAVRGGRLRMTVQEEPEGQADGQAEGQAVRERQVQLLQSALLQATLGQCGAVPTADQALAAALVADSAQCTRHRAASLAPPLDHGVLSRSADDVRCAKAWVVTMEVFRCLARVGEAPPDVRRSR